MESFPFSVFESFDGVEKGNGVSSNRRGIVDRWTTFS